MKTILFLVYRATANQKYREMFIFSQLLVQKFKSHFFPFSRSQIARVTDSQSYVNSNFWIDLLQARILHIDTGGGDAKRLFTK